jgi:hypothetical protein
MRRSQGLDDDQKAAIISHPESLCRDEATRHQGSRVDRLGRRRGSNGGIPARTVQFPAED